MASLPGPHKSLIQKASRGKWRPVRVTAWRRRGRHWRAAEFHTPAASIDSSLDWDPLARRNEPHLTGAHRAVNALNGPGADGRYAACARQWSDKRQLKIDGVHAQKKAPPAGK